MIKVTDFKSIHTDTATVAGLTRCEIKVDGKPTNIWVNHNDGTVKVQLRHWGDMIFLLDDYDNFEGDMRDFLEHSINKAFDEMDSNDDDE